MSDLECLCDWDAEESMFSPHSKGPHIVRKALDCPLHGDTTLDERVRAAEEIITALGELVEAMYNSSLERSWPTRSIDMVRAYDAKYGTALQEGEGL